MSMTSLTFKHIDTEKLNTVHLHKILIPFKRGRQEGADVIIVNRYSVSLD